MADEKGRRLPGSESTAQHDVPTSEPSYNASTRAARHKGPAWFRFWLADWQAATARYKAAERGILCDLLGEMNRFDAPVPEDHRRLARLCGTTPATLKPAIEVFIYDGLVTREGAGLWSPWAEKEKEWRKKQSELQRKKSSQRWEKSEQNQRSDDAGANRGREEERKRSSGAGPSARAPSGKRQRSTFNGDDISASADGETAGPRERGRPSGRVFHVGLRFRHPKLGHLEVTKVYPQERRVEVRSVDNGETRMAKVADEDTIADPPAAARDGEDGDC